MIRDVKLEKAEGIHNHIGYLYVPEEANCGKNYVGITLGEADFNFTGIRDKKQSKVVFKKEQIFNTFSNETFGQLAYISKKSYDKIFVTRGMTNNNPIRIGAFRASRDIYEKYSVGVIDKNNEWCLFEIAVGISGLIATHKNGLKGIEFNEWLINFIKEINYDYKVKEIEYEEDEYWKKYKREIIPMCTSSISSPWNEVLARYLKEKIGCNIGVFYGSLGKESRDFYIKEYMNNIPKLVGESKYYQDNMTNQQIKEIINRLKEYKSKINLIVVKNINEKINNIDTKEGNVYLLKSEGDKLIIKNIKKSEKDIGFLIIPCSLII